MMFAPVADLIAAHGAHAFIFAACVFLVAGFVKGAIGFALPLIAVTGSTLVLPAELAVATIALPAFVMNTWQALLMGWGPAVATFKRFLPLNATLLAMIFISARMLPGLDDRVFFGILGVGVSFFAAVQLIGWRPQIAPQHEVAAFVAAGLIGGFFGGLAGVWGPPMVLMLLALNTPKEEFVRACGVSWALGSIPFLIGHASTGVLNQATLTLSAVALIPVGLGMWLGLKLQKRLDGALLRRIILGVLVVMGLNLLRRAVF